jgi:predicted amidophosphoribosyltransferase
MPLTVTEASETYETAMRNIQPAGPGICAVCKTFIEDAYPRCYACGIRNPDHLDVVVPITYSEHLGQMHHVLRQYKEPGPADPRRYAAVRLTAILWRFLEAHEHCLAQAAGIDGFDLVTVVPSSDQARDNKNALRVMVEGCGPIKQRFVRALQPTGKPPPGARDFDAARYQPTATFTARRVLLIDDTWTTGGHAQSAAYTLKAAGAASVTLAVIGRHVRPEYGVQGTTCGDLLAALPRHFDWDTCCLESPPAMAATD